MSTSSNRTQGHGAQQRTMTRSQFLTAGATAAAAASMGALPLAAATRTHTRRAKTDCQECLPENDKWEISASVLNAFWTDCFPRLVAEWWADDSGAPYPNNPQLTAVLDGGIGPNVVDAQLGSQVRALVNASNRPNLAARQEFVADYLESGLTTSIPIRFFPGKGFDFVLSDWGLDLFAPSPPDLLELYRYYSFRRTGRPTIGLPFYMAEGNSAVDIDSPTGPSQAWVDPDLLLETLVNGAKPTNYHCVTDAMKCATGFLELVSDEQQDAWAAARQPNLERFAGRARRWFERLVRAAREAEQDLSEEEVRELQMALQEIADTVETSPNAALSTDSVKCVLGAIRCWQLSGAVYRGIQGELPRIVATAWMEHVVGSQGPSQSYFKRLGMDGAMSGEGLREILAERLESDIPDPPSMVVDFQSKPGDLIIKSQGLFFPEIEDYKTAAGVPTGTDEEVLSSALTAIAQGDAGNPVFTDSMRTN